VAFRQATGRKITVRKNPKTARDIMRRHLREEGKRIVDLCEVWDMRPMKPQMIDAFIELLKLDHEDATELRLFAAIEAGWQLDCLKEKL
jgi:chromatin segregation and condensation protein Rec8/ScpA/Scc1 (kleisin family)